MIPGSEARIRSPTAANTGSSAARSLPTASNHCAVDRSSPGLVDVPDRTCPNSHSRTCSADAAPTGGSASPAGFAG
ncbi:hypothetical protein J7S33_09550, partial [Saccharothrix algeriensis]